MMYMLFFITAPRQFPSLCCPHELLHHQSCSPVCAVHLRHCISNVPLIVLVTSGSMPGKFLSLYCLLVPLHQECSSHCPVYLCHYTRNLSVSCLFLQIHQDCSLSVFVKRCPVTCATSCRRPLHCNI
jgi:hypothetical protein